MRGRNQNQANNDHHDGGHDHDRRLPGRGRRASPPFVAGPFPGDRSAFRIEKIRAGRKKPGLLRQHLTAVLAAAEVGGAEVEGAALGSRQVVFHPGPIRSGNYTFRVGTAGSATLVLQTVLPALLLAEDESNLVLEGGTHNPMAPPVDFLEKAYLPLLNRLGPRVEVQLVRPGLLSGRRREVHRPRPAGEATWPP